MTLFAGVMLLVGACSGERGAPGSNAADANADTRQPGSAGVRGGMMSGRMRMPMMGELAPADTAATPRASAAAAAATGACPVTGQPLVDRGRLIFGGAGNCFTCHGSRAAGTAVAPDLTDATWLNVDGSYASLIRLVRDGVPHPKRYPAPMPPMGGARLSDDQVCAVAAYVYSLWRR